MGLLKRDEERNRLRPTGGKKKAKFHIDRMMTPRCSRMDAKAVPSGITSASGRRWLERFQARFPAPAAPH